jgi:hypothetical protein
MRSFTSRALPWLVLSMILAVIGLVVLDGTAAGIVLAVATIGLFVALARALAGADMSGVRGGPGPGGS